MGGAERLNAIKTISVKANVKHWEPEQSDVPGGEPRFAAQSTVEVVQDRSRRAQPQRLGEELRLSRAAHLHLQRDRHA